MAETELSADDVFNFFLRGFQSSGTFAKQVRQHAASKKLKRAASHEVVAFACVQQNAATNITYRKVPLPWYVLLLCESQDISPLTSTIPFLSCSRPLTDRDMFYVQDFVRVVGDRTDDSNTRDRRWFFTYNHDIDHAYFAQRSGFIRAKMKYQGMVGALGDGGKTRLTWLANIDFGGTVPTSFTNSFLVGLMYYPMAIVADTRKWLQTREGNARGSGGGGCKDAAAASVDAPKRDQHEKIEELMAQLEAERRGRKEDKAQFEAALERAEEKNSVLRRRLKRSGQERYVQ